MTTAASDLAIAGEPWIFEQRLTQSGAGRVDIHIPWQRFDGLIDYRLEALMQGMALRLVLQAAA